MLRIERLNGTNRLEFLLCTLTSEVQCQLVHRNHVIWRTKITFFLRNGNDSKQRCWIGTNNLVSFSSSKTPTLFCNWQTSSLANRKRGTLKRRYPLLSTDFPYYSLTIPHREGSLYPSALCVWVLEAFTITKCTWSASKCSIPYTFHWEIHLKLW